MASISDLKKTEKVSEPESMSVFFCAVSAELTEGMTSLNSMYLTYTHKWSKAQQHSYLR